MTLSWYDIDLQETVQQALLGLSEWIQGSSCLWRYIQSSFSLGYPTANSKSIIVVVLWGDDNSKYTLLRRATEKLHNFSLLHVKHITILLKLTFMYLKLRYAGNLILYAWPCSGLIAHPIFTSFAISANRISSFPWTWSHPIHY
jgi:hypothetical protein